MLATGIRARGGLFLPGVGNEKEKKMLNDGKGCLFDNGAAIRINTVNCYGVMGAGVAKAFKARYPKMFVEYKALCDAGKVRVGELHKFVAEDCIIVNFPTKNEYWKKSKIKYIKEGLEKLREFLVEYSIEHAGAEVALPALGCGHGKLNWTEVQKLIVKYLGDIDLKILVYGPEVSKAFDKEDEGERAPFKN